MNERGVDRQAFNGDRLSLHSRLKIFRTTHAEVVDLLEAIKWAGNDAAHVNGKPITASNVVEMADMLDVALKLLFTVADTAIQARALEIMASKGLPILPPRHLTKAGIGLDALVTGYDVANGAPLGPAAAGLGARAAGGFAGGWAAGSLWGSLVGPEGTLIVGFLGGVAGAAGADKLVQTALGG